VQPGRVACANGMAVTSAAENPASQLVLRSKETVGKIAAFLTSTHKSSPVHTLYPTHCRFDLDMRQSCPCHTTCTSRSDPQKNLLGKHRVPAGKGEMEKSGRDEYPEDGEKGHEKSTARRGSSPLQQPSFYLCVHVSCE